MELIAVLYMIGIFALLYRVFGDSAMTTAARYYALAARTRQITWHSRIHMFDQYRVHEEIRYHTQVLNRYLGIHALFNLAVSSCVAMLGVVIYSWTQQGWLTAYLTLMISCLMMVTVGWQVTYRTIKIWEHVMPFAAKLAKICVTMGLVLAVAGATYWSGLVLPKWVVLGLVILNTGLVVKILSTEDTNRPLMVVYFLTWGLVVGIQFSINQTWLGVIASAITATLAPMILYQLRNNAPQLVMTIAAVAVIILG